MIGEFHLNIYAVLVATVASVVLGALWYSPILFGKEWVAALGKTEDELGSGTPAMIGSVFASVVSAVALAVVIGAFGATTLAAGASVGALCGFGLVATAILSDALFSGWSWTRYFIQAGYRVVYLIAMGAIIGGW